jgi:hypothetical protein
MAVTVIKERTERKQNCPRGASDVGEHYVEPRNAVMAGLGPAIHVFAA